MEASKWVLTPCTAAKSEKDAVAGDEGPAMQCPTKRKAVAGSSYKEGDGPAEGFVDFYKHAEPASFDPFGSQSRAAAIDKILLKAVLPAASVAAVKQAPEAAAGGGGGGGGGSKPKRRLTKREIASIIALKLDPYPSADYLDLAQFEAPETIAEKRRQDEEDAAYLGNMDKKFEAFRQEVIKGLKEDGYYEVDHDYLASAKEKANQQPAWKPFSFADPIELRRHVATPEQYERWLREGSIRRYVPDAEDARLISYGEDDDGSVSDDEEDSDDASDEEEDSVRKATAIEAN